ncbi:MAG: hypothetical protein PHT02_00600 [Tissierellia bacterium]|nr:hypothetical protein [Tissierellia bacterium]
MKKFWKKFGKVFWIVLFGTATISWGIDFYNLLNGIIPSNWSIGLAIVFSGAMTFICMLREFSN